MKTSLTDGSTGAINARLNEGNKHFAQAYPGETGNRQPVHTVYGGAHLFRADTAQRLGALARRSLDQFAPDFLVFAKALSLPGADELPDSAAEAEELRDISKITRGRPPGKQIRLARPYDL